MADNIVKVYKYGDYFPGLDVTRTFTVLNSADLDITNQLDPNTKDVFFKGETIKFVIEVTNGTSGDIPSFKIEDDFPAAITVTDAQLTADAGAGIVLTRTDNHVEVNAASFKNATPNNTFKVEVTGTAN